MRNQKDENSIYHADCLPAFLPFNKPVLTAQVEGIEEDLDSRLEADSMFETIAAILCFVPFESHLYIHYRIYINDRNNRRKQKPGQSRASLIQFSYRSASRKLRRHLLGNECLDLVAFLHVVEVGDPHAAFHAVGDLARIVLEALER